MAVRPGSAHTSRTMSINDDDDLTDNMPRRHTGLLNIYQLSCRSWPDCLLTTVTVLLLTGITMLIVGFVVPRSPPASAKEELPARAYETLVTEYASRGYILDVVMVFGLVCLLICAIVLSTLHVGVYFRGDGFFPLFPARLQRRPSCDGENSTSLSEALVLSRVGYGGLAQTEH